MGVVLRSAGNHGTANYPVRDNQTYAPDITGVEVTTKDDGFVSVSVTMNDPGARLASGQWLDVYIDSDNHAKPAATTGTTSTSTPAELRSRSAQPGALQLQRPLGLLALQERRGLGPTDRLDEPCRHVHVLREQLVHDAYLRRDGLPGRTGPARVLGRSP